MTPLSPSIRYHIQSNPASSHDSHESPPPLIRLKLSPVEQQRLLASLDGSDQASISIQLAGPNSAIHLGSDLSSSIPLQLISQTSTHSTDLLRLSNSNNLQSIGSINHSLHSLSSATSTPTASSALSHQELASKLRKRREEDEARKRDKAAVLLDPEEQRRLQQSKNKTSKGAKSSSKPSPIRKSSVKDIKIKNGGGSSNLLSVGSSSSSRRGSSPSSSTPTITKTSPSKSVDDDSQLMKEVGSTINTTLRRKLIQTLASSPLKRKYLASHMDCSENQILPLLDLVADPVDSKDSKGKQKSSGGSETIYKLKDELFTQVRFSKESWSDYSSIQRKNASFSAEAAFGRIGLDQDSEIGRGIWSRLWPEGGREEWIEKNEGKLKELDQSISEPTPEKKGASSGKFEEEKDEDSLEEGEEREIKDQPSLKLLPRIKKVSDRASESPNSNKRSIRESQRDEVIDSDTVESKKKIKGGSTHDRLRKATKNRTSSSSTTSASVNASTSKSQDPDKSARQSNTPSTTSHSAVEMPASTSASSANNKRSRKLSRSVSPPSWLANTKTKKQGNSNQSDNNPSKKDVAGGQDVKSKVSDLSISISGSKRKAPEKKVDSNNGGKKKGKKLDPKNLDYTDSEEEEVGGADSSRSQVKSESLKSNKRIKQENDKSSLQSSEKRNTIVKSNPSDQKVSRTKNESRLEDQSRKPSKTVLAGEVERGRNEENSNQSISTVIGAGSSRDFSYPHTRERSRSRSYSRSISFDSREGSFSSLDDHDSLDSRYCKLRRSVSGNSSANSDASKSRSTSRNSFSDSSDIRRPPLESNLKSSISPSTVPLRPPGPGVSIHSNGNEPPWLSIKSSSDYTRLVERFLKSFQDYRILKARCEKEKEMLLMEEGMLEVETEREIREIDSSTAGAGQMIEGDHGMVEDAVLGNGDFVKIEHQESSSRTRDDHGIDQSNEDVEMKDQSRKQSEDLRISTNHSKVEDGKTSNPNPPSSPEEGEMTPQVDNQESRFGNQQLPSSHSNSTITESNMNREEAQDADPVIKGEESSKSRSESPPAVWRVVPPLIESNSRRHSNQLEHFSNQSRPMGFNELKELVEKTKDLFGQLKRMRETLLEHKAKHSMKLEDSY